MATRPELKTITKKLQPDEPVPEKVSQLRRPDVGQFRLQVDRQTKGSYLTLEAAETAGMAIKQGHPLVQVSVYDTGAGTNKIIEAPKS